MIPLSGMILDDCVTLTLNRWGQDADGSRVVASTVTVPYVAAAVLPGKPDTRREHNPEGELVRVTEFTPYTVQFDADAGLSVHDLVAWVDDVGVTHMLLVVGYGQPAGRPGCWVACCEERI